MYIQDKAMSFTQCIEDLTGRIIDVSVAYIFLLILKVIITNSLAVHGKDCFHLLVIGAIRTKIRKLIERR